MRKVTYRFIYFPLFSSFFKTSFFIFCEKCRYVGNIHTQVTEPLLQEVFASTGPVEGCKLIRKEKVNLRDRMLYGKDLIVVCCYFLPVHLVSLLACKLFLTSLLSPLLQSSYGFIHYFDRRAAALAILSLNGRHLWVACFWLWIVLLLYWSSKLYLKFVSAPYYCTLGRFGQPIKVNWAYASGQREDTSGWFSLSFSVFFMF